MQVDFGAGPESDHGIHLAPHTHNHTHAHPHPHFEHSSHSSPGFSSFRHPAAPSIDPGLDQGATPSRNGHQPMTSVHQPSAAQGHLLPPENASLNSPHLAHSFYADMSRTSQTPSTPPNSSPHFSNLSPAPPASKQLPNRSYVPADRPVPSRDASDDTFDDAYAAFILYCNPNFSTDTDTTELIRQFRTPPKSDGKAFSTWTLFELIRKFDAKEIKTWTQLALDLGVEPPDTDKGQSTQKVQQYSVRLKRWMRAMHIDAFFEFMLGKQHPYYLQIPPPHNPFPEGGRDGVSLGEDLAIRALDPKFRPKRGRRKADEGDDELDMADSTPPRKRPHLDTTIPFGNVLQPQSAYPSSAHPDNMDGFLGANDPWSTPGITPSSAMTSAAVPGRMNAHKNLTPYSASPLSGQQIRWRVNAQDNPTTPHPLSAVTPQSAHPDFFDEPQSAVTPSSSSKPRARRRHGPAVSSAWPSNNTSSTGKLRGRPPSNRSVRDGPFVTFPANPKTKEGPPIEMNRTTGNLTPIVERAQSDPPAEQQHQQQQFRFPPTPASAVSPTTIDSQLQSSQRPHRLSLQVPKNVGNPVRLVTPTVLVNGEEDPTPSTAMASSAISADSDRSSPAQGYLRNEQHQQLPPHQHPPARSHPSPHHQTPSSAATTSTHLAHQTPLHPSPSTSSLALPSIPGDALNRALVAEIIRAPLSGRRKRLRGFEAKNLAAAILHPILPPPPSHPSASPFSTDSPNPLLTLTLASCLGLASNLTHNHNLHLPPPLSHALHLAPTGGVRKIECVRFRVGGDGYESPVDEDEEDGDDAARGDAGAVSNPTTTTIASATAASAVSAGRAGGTIRESFDVYFSVRFGASAGGNAGGGDGMGALAGGARGASGGSKGGESRLVGEWVARGLSTTSLPPPPRHHHHHHPSSSRTAYNNNDDESSSSSDVDDEDIILDPTHAGDGLAEQGVNDDDSPAAAAVWKAKFLRAKRKLREKRDEVRRVREGVLDVALF